jgi:chaperonin GroEL (HSP60 family)
MMTAQLAKVTDHRLRRAETAVVHNGSVIPSRASDNVHLGGVQFDCGYLSPYFITDPERMEVAFKNVFILIHEKKLSSRNDLLPLLDQIAKNSNPLLIIAEDISCDALATLVVRKLCGSLQVCAVKTPGFGTRRKAMSHFIAILTGGKAITEPLDVNLRNIQISDLGWARRITVDKSSTVVEGRTECDRFFFQPKIGARLAYTSLVDSSLTQILGVPHGTLSA